MGTHTPKTGIHFIEQEGWNVPKIPSCNVFVDGVCVGTFKPNSDISTFRFTEAISRDSDEVAELKRQLKSLKEYYNP